MAKSTGGAGRQPRMKADDGPIAVNTETIAPLHTGIPQGQMMSAIKAKEQKLADKTAKAAAREARRKK